MENPVPIATQTSNESISPIPQVRTTRKFLSSKIVFIALSITVTLSLSAGTYSLIASSQTPITSPREPVALQLPLSPTPFIRISTPTASPTPSPSPTILPTATPTPQPIVWNRYNNILYGYSIDYPPDWNVQDLGILEPQVPSFIVFNPNSASTSARALTISVSTRTYQDQLALGASSSAITVAGIIGTKQSFSDSDGNTATLVVLPRTNNLLLISAETAYEAFFNQMITTLTITD